MIVEQLVESVNFAAGEISPRLRNRRDLGRRQTGVDKLENMIVLLEGGATRRSGTRFVLPLADESEVGALIRFLYSPTDSYLIVVNGGVIRFFVDGGYLEKDAAPYEVPDAPWAPDDLENLRVAQDGNQVWIACTGYQTRVLTRNDALDWSLDLYQPENGPVDTQNLDGAVTVTSDALTGPVALTASDDIFVPGDVGSVWRFQEPDLSAVPLWTAEETGLSAGDQRRYNGNVYAVKSGSDCGVNPPTNTEGDLASGEGTIVWTYLHSGYGFVRVTAVTDGENATGDVVDRLPDAVKDSGTYRWSAGAWSIDKGWPDKVVLYQDRLWFFRDDYFWATETDLFTRFDVDFEADGALEGRLRSDTGQKVIPEWAINGGVLIVGNRADEWIIRATDPAGTVTMTDIKPMPRSDEGSAPHVPAHADGGAIFIGRDRQRLNYVAFDFQTQALAPDEITLAARHILKGLAAGVTFQRDPNRVLWTWCQDGSLVGFTFMPKQNVLGAHRHPLTNGVVEAAETIFSGDGATNETYLIVRREIDGMTRRYIERLQPFFAPLDTDNPTADGAWFVDCGLEYDGAPTDQLTGLDHLEGQEVAIHADGSGHARKTVAGGKVTLDREVSKAVVGLPIAYRIKGLPVELTTRSGVSKGMAKSLPQVVVDVVDSAGGNVASNGGTPEALVETGDLDYGAAVPLFTGPITRSVDSPEGDEAYWEISGDDTMPLTIAGVAPDVEVAGA